MCTFLKSHQKLIRDKHIVIIQNDNLNVSYVDEEELRKYLLVTHAIQKLKINNVSILQNASHGQM
jgi:hypothetical protein